MTISFRSYFDETGTDGKSPYVIVAGAMADNKAWDYLEKAWDKLLTRNHVSEFHFKEFAHREADFLGWSNLKLKRFVVSLERILEKAPVAAFAVAVHKQKHKAIKEKMKGVRGFSPASDYGLAFRMFRFFVCDQIHKQYPGAKVSFIAEEGPYTAGAATIYEEVRSTVGARYRPARYAEMLDGFSTAPKGQLRALEAADYLCGRAITDLDKGTLIKPGRPNQVALRATPSFLQTWYQDMLKEREHRKQHAAKRRPSRKEVPASRCPS